MPTFAQLQQASFLGNPFPIVSCEVRGGLRDHVHEYPHSPGGAPEKLGRRLYTIHMVGEFHTTFAKYPNLFPKTLATLRKAYEDQTTGPLVVPFIGTIQAYCINWVETASSQSSSGLTASFEFREDSGQANLVSALLSVNATTLQSARDALDAQRVSADFAGDKTATDLFDAISNAANSVLAVVDQIELQGNLLSARVDSLLSLMQQFDNLAFSKNPINFPLIDTMRDLWDAGLELDLNLKSNQVKPRVYVVPNTMPVNLISQALYGDTSHGMELMQINPIEDPFRVSAGTHITYYPAVQ